MLLYLSTNYQRDNFKLLSSLEAIDNFRLIIEINVAFDDNEYYSDFDFPDDEIFHSGTGQLGTLPYKNYFLCFRRAAAKTGGGKIQFS